MALAQIEHEIELAERTHAGEIRVAVETALALPALWHNVTPRARALALFAHFRIWDTHANNGVLIYVLRADRAVEIVADRGISARVTSAEWEGACRDEVSERFRQGDPTAGSSVAVAGVGAPSGTSISRPASRRGERTAQSAGTPLELHKMKVAIVGALSGPHGGWPRRSW